MPDTKSGKITLLVCILHNHSFYCGTTAGKITVDQNNDEKTAEGYKKRIQAWLDEKKREHGCAKYGDNCGVDIREAHANRNSLILALGAEEIK